MSDITVKIKGDASGFQKEWKKTQGTISNTLTGGGLGVSSMVSGVLAGFSIGAIISEVKSLVNELDNIGDSSKVFEMLPKEFQIVSYAAKKTGADAKDVGMSFKKMNEMINGAIEGTNKEAMAAFRHLKLDPKELEDMSAFDKYQKITGAIEGLTNGTKRNAAANALLGRSYQYSLQIAREIPEAMKEADKFDLLFKDKDIKSAEDIADAMLRFGIVMKKGIIDTGLLTEISELTKALETLLLVVNKLQAISGGSIAGAMGASVKGGIAATFPATTAVYGGVKTLAAGRDMMMSNDNPNLVDTGIQAMTSAALSGASGIIPGAGSVVVGIDILTQIYNVLNGRLPGGTSTGEVMK
jgi:hypothetical protein